MVTVETIGRIRRAVLVDKKPIRQIVRELRISRQTVRKAVRSSSTEFRYERQVQPQPRLGAFVARLTRAYRLKSGHASKQIRYGRGNMRISCGRSRLPFQATRSALPMRSERVAG